VWQLVDDVLDFEQTSETLGKPALADLKQGLATAPVLLAAQVRETPDSLNWSPCR
jgi:geranylgeranyl pyrophosphate synthase